MANNENFPSSNENYQDDSERARQQQQLETLVDYNGPEAVAFALSTLPDEARRQVEDALFANADLRYGMAKHDQDAQYEQERSLPLSSEEIGSLLEVVKGRAYDNIQEARAELGETDNSTLKNPFHRYEGDEAKHDMLEAQIDYQAADFVRSQLAQGKDFDDIRRQAEDGLTADGEDFLTQRGSRYEAELGLARLDKSYGTMHGTGIAAIALLDMIEQHPDKARDVLDQASAASDDEKAQQSGPPVFRAPQV